MTVIISAEFFTRVSLPLAGGARFLYVTTACLAPQIQLRTGRNSISGSSRVLSLSKILKNI